MNGSCGEARAWSGAAEAQALLRDAMHYSEGETPGLSGEVIYENSYFRMTHDAFVFSTPGGALISYRLGERVVLDYPDPQLAGECQLYLWGTVFGAVAWLNGMMPLHCSAIASENGAIAFTAASGGGKSTLTAALVRRGYRHICDDTLVIAEDAGHPIAIPDGKPAKLWRDALDLVDGIPLGEVANIEGKFYTEPGAVCSDPCPLRHLVFIEQGEAVSLEPILGGAKLERLGEAIYRGFVHTARGDRDFHARMMLLLSGQVQFWTLRRPMDAARFDAVADEIAACLSGLETRG